ncbi:MAG: glycosyltransferase [Waddliaceae bacterium]|jgi:glycosyltransferase involved in cell wall biosynthesis|nr:glycosyltransferase [Waddliaceae bacterium]MBT3578998.1 glycosyltransferase [Waddliaceae bacterium]MBT6928598.1 glycosyltransferase [Waddliaceae bacterium]MBT7264249.1 glycosyltransferase [Waddliaceae bacterium]
MKIVVLTVGDKDAGSTKFRITQYIPFLEKQGYSVTLIHQKDIDSSIVDVVADADVVINQKCLIAMSLARKIRANSKRLIFDFDDAVYTRHGKPYSFITQWRVNKRIRFWLKNSDTVVAANCYLKKYADRYRDKACVIPMAIDFDTWKPIKRNDDDIVIGWAGAPNNLYHLKRLEAVLSTILKKHPRVSFRVFSGKKPDLAVPFSYTPFVPGTEHFFTQELDIGLLPLSEDDFSKGKSPIKAIQYLACGVPVVGNIFGATHEILNKENSIAVENDEEWISALETLIQQRSLAKTMGECGRRYVLSINDIKATRQQFLKLLSE